MKLTEFHLNSMEKHILVRTIGSLRKGEERDATAAGTSRPGRCGSSLAGVRRRRVARPRWLWARVDSLAPAPR